MTVAADKLITMVNQIWSNMDFGQGQHQVVEKVADHLQRFWDPRMRKSLIDYCRRDQDQMDAGLLKLIEKLEQNES